MSERENLAEVMFLLGGDTLLCDELRNSEPTPAESARQRLYGIGRSNAVEEEAGLSVALALTACCRKRLH
jgi:hypothetical protein